MLEQMFMDTFKHLGKTALYSAEGSGFVEITVLIKEPEQAYELGDGKFVERIATFEIMAKDVLNPKVGDTLYVDGRRYKIYQDPLLSHEYHLIHRAMGWMLREVGKKDKDVFVRFLAEYKNHLPRITLSYAKELLRTTTAQ
jgi:hypothetical protein